MGKHKALSLAFGDAEAAHAHHVFPADRHIGVKLNESGSGHEGDAVLTYAACPGIVMP